MSKILESVMCDQIMNYFNEIMSESMSAYRKLYSTNNVILKCIEDWRFALDNKKVIGCVAMDLSKAFDSIPHGLLIAKFSAYGACTDACHFINSYLSNRKQRVKLNGHYSDWSYILRGVPQGSLMGPVLFNVYLNDLLVILEKECVVYNYADDNTLSYVHSDANVVKDSLEKACNIAITWFNSNFMRVNPDKFQFMLLQSRNEFSLDLLGNTVNPTDMIKLLGVYIDKNLNFSHHVKELIRHSSKQVNVLGRLSRQLSVTCKLRILDAFIVSNFNYCSLAYHECKMSDACKLERLLKRALRYVFSDFTSPYVDLLRKAKKCPLYVRRNRVLLESVHKILNGKYLPIGPEFYVRSESVYNLRNTDLLLQPVFNTVKYGRNSLRYKGTQQWNIMPDQLKCEDFTIFKQHVMNIIQPCQCGACGFCRL